MTKRQGARLTIRFLEERDKAVLSLDVEKFKKFHAKWVKLGYYDDSLPSDEILEISLRKMVCAISSATPEQRREAEEWLLSRGYRPDIY